MKMDKKNMKKLPAILKMKCPSCHEGDLFETPTWSFQKPFDMPKECPNCKLNYFPEPGFYWGAMFISYIFWGFFCVIFGGACIMGLGWSVNKTTLVLLAISAVFFVWLFRTSRAAWFNAVVHYDEKVTPRK